MQKHKKALRLKLVIAFLWKHRRIVLKIVLIIIKIINAIFRTSND